MPQLNLPELLVIGFLAILFFGKDKLPETAKSLGESFNIFKNSITENKKEIEKSEKTTDIKAENIAN